MDYWLEPKAPDARSNDFQKKSRTPAQDDGYLVSVPRGDEVDEVVVDYMSTECFAKLVVKKPDSKLHGCEVYFIVLSEDGRRALVSKDGHHHQALFLSTELVHAGTLKESNGGSFGEGGKVDLAQAKEEWEEATYKSKGRGHGRGGGGGGRQWRNQVMATGSVSSMNVKVPWWRSGNR